MRELKDGRIGMAIVVVGAVCVDVKGFPMDLYLPTGRNAGDVEIVHGGVGRNVAEDIANVSFGPPLSVWWTRAPRARRSCAS